ncbi:MAG: endonuclease, partial [Bacteroidales bacterium]|nr:endonuclease [Bacteroidales bacterium]
MRKLLLTLLALTLAFSAGASIRVMSYNVRLGVAKDGDNSWENRREATPAMLREIRPAVFGVQEAYDFQIAYILEQCPEYKAVGVGRDDGKSDGEHMSVFY